MQAFVRYFCRVTSQPGDSYGDLAFSYFEAMVGAGVSIRVVAYNMARIIGHYETVSEEEDAEPVWIESRWEKYSKNLIEPVPTNFINVVCGAHAELARLLTVGCPNVAIIGPLADVEPSVLVDYDLVLCQSLPDTEELLSHGANAVCAIPEGKDLAVLFRNLV